MLQVCSFTDDQVTHFVRCWYLAVERHSTGTAGEDVRLRAESEADDLLKRLNDAPGLYDLRVNPLLLTMIATVHRYRGALPGSRADLYGEICQVMLWRRQEAKSLPIELDGDKKEGLLRGLAFAMMCQRVRDLPRAEVIDKVRPALRRMSRNLTAEDFLIVIGSNGLLIERESGLYSFAHHTFQEYLAATHIRDKGFHSILADAVDDGWWRETTLLYAARSDADPIVRACLDSTSVTALSLAFDCADQNSELEPELRNHLDKLLASVFEPHTDPERRRLMTGVLITRHLRHPIQTGNGGRVCARPITTGLYWLYQQDTQGIAPEGPTQREPDIYVPIVGVRGSDAVAFARWINAVIGTGTNTVYRLPTLTEINDSAVQRALTTRTHATQPHSVWLEPDSGHGRPQLWKPVRNDHPHTIDATTLVSHVKDDIDHSTPTLTRLLLLRSDAAAQILVRARDLNLALARDLARDLARAHNLALESDLDLVLALDRALDRDVAPALERALVLEDDLPLDLDLVLARDLALDRVFDLGFARARGLDLVLARDLARVTGSALSQALTRTYRTTPATWPADFSRAFVEAIGFTEAKYIVSSDALADKVHSGCDALLEFIRRPDDNMKPHPWAHQVAINFEETALPIFTRQRPLTSDTATVLRIAVLCLAAEADTRGARPIGNTFREIAAGITLLERRVKHQMLPTETILLAIT